MEANSKWTNKQDKIFFVDDNAKTMADQVDISLTIVNEFIRMDY